MIERYSADDARAFIFDRLTETRLISNQAGIPHYAARLLYGAGFDPNVASVVGDGMGRESSVMRAIARAVNAVAPRSTIDDVRVRLLAAAAGVISPGAYVEVHKPHGAHAFMADGVPIESRDVSIGELWDHVTIMVTPVLPDAERDLARIGEACEEILRR